MRGLLLLLVNPPITSWSVSEEEGTVSPPLKKKKVSCCRQSWVWCVSSRREKSERGGPASRTENENIFLLKNKRKEQIIVQYLIPHPSETEDKAHTPSFFSPFLLLISPILLFCVPPSRSPHIFTTSGRQSRPFICEIETFHTPTSFSADTYAQKERKRGHIYLYFLKSICEERKEKKTAQIFFCSPKRSSWEKMKSERPFGLSTLFNQMFFNDPFKNKKTWRKEKEVSLFF